MDFTGAGIGQVVVELLEMHGDAAKVVRMNANFLLDEFESTPNRLAAALKLSAMTATGRMRTRRFTPACWREGFQNLSPRYARISVAFKLGARIIEQFLLEVIRSVAAQNIILLEFAELLQKLVSLFRC
jgi:hypothetical protein